MALYWGLVHLPSRRGKEAFSSVLMKKRLIKHFSLLAHRSAAMLKEPWFMPFKEIKLLDLHSLTQILRCSSGATWCPCARPWPRRPRLCPPRRKTRGRRRGATTRGGCWRATWSASTPRGGCGWSPTRSTQGPGTSSPRPARTSPRGAWGSTPTTSPAGPTPGAWAGGPTWARPPGGTCCRSLGAWSWPRGGTPPWPQAGP
mmetsp:Transcript_27188/g.42892  ORF Transcript_27188/g.42892 Transcript_27188/m.42892 type:complete len:201 (-) Transcript_27188:22-624(-)